MNTGTLSFGIGATNHAGGTLTLTSGSATIGTLVFNSNTTGGQGIVNLNGGTLTLSSITVTGGQTRQINFNGGQFVAGASLPAFSGLTMNVQNGGANINTNGNSFTISDALLNNGSGGLVKTGAGTLTLAGANTFTGATTVSAGTLALSTAGTNNIANSAEIIIGSSGTLDVPGVSGVFQVAAGQSLGGTGTVAGNFGFASTSILDVVDLNDSLALTGTVTFGAGFGIANIAGVDWDAVDLNTPYTILSTSQTFTAFDIDNFGSANQTAVDTGRFAYFQNGSLQLVVVPEPGTMAVLAAGAICGIMAL